MGPATDRLITDDMETLAAFIRPGVDRPVTTDPRNITPPCVLIEPPRLTPGTTLCADTDARYSVLVVGLPGAWAELGALARLLADTLRALDAASLPWLLAEPISYYPLAAAQSVEPSQAYRIQIGE
ncbi:hypothetical protein ACIRQY_29090 [Streptomyces sp. NPDC101490]|uniref:hypothetical protein n=1 Tax=Streptomyces sp. NPDC101490 TaxID=3366143 RepID=UPI003808327B